MSDRPYYVDGGDTRKDHDALDVAVCYALGVTRRLGYRHTVHETATGAKIAEFWPLPEWAVTR